MTLIPESTQREVRGISCEQKSLMKAYIQGLVYAWVRDRSGQVFAARDLAGGPNFEWSGTPLFPLYEKHIVLGKSSDDAIAGAAKDFGWLLKSVLNEDKRTFEAGRSGLTAGYRWVGNEP